MTNVLGNVIIIYYNKSQHLRAMGKGDVVKEKNVYL